MAAEQDVLDDLTFAHKRVKDCINGIDTFDDRLDALGATARERLEALKDRYAHLVGHLATQKNRVREAEEALRAEMTEVVQWLNHDVPQSEADAGKLVDSMGDFADASRAESETLGHGVEAATAEAKAGHGAITQLADTWLPALLAKTEGGQKAVGEAASGWDGQLQTGSTAGREAMTARMQSDLQPQRADTRARAQATAKALAAASTERGTLAQTKVTEHVTAASAKEKEGRDGLRQRADQLSSALQNLTGTLTTASTAAIEGADTASDLMQATNVGIGTVIGIFENLREIFQEVEDMWQND